MNLLGSFVIALSMYSRIPMPQVEWTKERMRYAMCFFSDNRAYFGRRSDSVYLGGVCRRGGNRL